MSYDILFVMKESKILVTGGLGYVGSHTVVELIQAGYEVVIVDNLVNSSIEVLQGIYKITGVMPEFCQMDLRNITLVASLFENYHFDGVIHFAAYKFVGESVQKPLMYYENNVSALVGVLRYYTKGNFIFSSSSTVYGQPKEGQVTELTPMGRALSPYGKSKAIAEDIIQDCCKVNIDFNAILLRYFNPIGAHDSTVIGELPNGVPQNLVPFIKQTAIGKRKELKVFGNDYPTPDGTCIRDYIHVVDVAKAHVKALERLLMNKADTNCEVFNVGTGRGSSVLEVIQAFEAVSGQDLNYSFVSRRQGDYIQAYADTSKINTLLGWRSEKTLKEALLSAWLWEQKING